MSNIAVPLHLFALLVIALSFSPLTAWAQVREEVFTDWVLSCGQSGQTDDEICRISQTSTFAEGEQDVFLLTISPRSEEPGFVGVITVPLGVYLGNGILISVDRRRPFQVQYEVCDQTACFAGFEMSGAVLSAFRNGYDARFRVWTGRESAVEFPVSLRGFTVAWRELGERISQ